MHSERGKGGWDELMEGWKKKSSTRLFQGMSHKGSNGHMPILIPSSEHLWVQLLHLVGVMRAGGEGGGGSF